MPDGVRRSDMIGWGGQVCGRIGDGWVGWASHGRVVVRGVHDGGGWWLALVFGRGRNVIGGFVGAGGWLVEGGLCRVLVRRPFCLHDVRGWKC